MRVAPQMSKPSQYHTQSLDEARKDQRIAELEAQLREKNAQLASSVKLPPPLTRTTTPPRFNSGGSERIMNNGARFNSPHHLNSRPNSPFRPPMGSTSPYRSQGFVGRSPGRESARVDPTSPSVKDGHSCHKCAGKGHYFGECPSKEPGMQAPFNCHNCQGRGHYANECPSRPQGAPALN